MPTLTVADAVKLILAQSPHPVAVDTVDTIKHGDTAAPLTGIVVTFMATRPVLARAAALKANFVITHEPTFYNHRDEHAWLDGEAVYQAKRSFLDDHRLVLWRVHDLLHHGWPDAIAAGMLAALGWESHVDRSAADHVRLPKQPLRQVVDHLKSRLGIPLVRVVGDLDAPCATVGFLPGACGGRRQIKLLSQPGVDVVVCGESPEWETCEYVRDAQAAGVRKALIVLGHANSEEAGMKAFADQVRPLFPSTIAVTHVPAGNPFQTL